MIIISLHSCTKVDNAIPYTECWYKCSQMSNPTWNRTVLKQRHANTYQVSLLRIQNKLKHDLSLNIHYWLKSSANEIHTPVCIMDELNTRLNNVYLR